MIKDNTLSFKRMQYIYNRVAWAEDKQEAITLISNKLFLSERTIRRDYKKYCDLMTRRQQ